MSHEVQTYPLISVIIPCYNHAVYLPKAIESVLEQDYPRVEIIVINDGSTDETAAVAGNYKRVKYFYQENKGLAASRNIGLLKSKGAFIVFLDADDWLLPGAISKNYQSLAAAPGAAMVSGAHIFYYQPEEKQWDIIKPIEASHYLALLQGNYIGMPSCVMYRREVAEAYPFNEQLKHCEDFEQYFRILRTHPVLHHTSLVAVYRNHGMNKSGNIPLVFETAMQILKSQEPLLKSEKEREAWHTGQYWLQDYYCNKLYNKLVDVLYKDREYITAAERQLLQQCRPQLLQQYEQELTKATAYFKTLE